MTTHLGVMILFAACVATVFGTILRENRATSFGWRARIFTALVFGAYALGWVMYLAFR